MKAVILAGGFGKRLRIAAEDVPKPMISIVGKPFLEHQIRLLKEQGIKEIILCVYYMADKIKSYFGDGRKFGVEITYSEEDTPLGTGGALKKAEKYLNDTFLVINSDLYAKIDLNKFYEFHKLKKGICTMGLTNASDALTEGNVLLQGEKIIGFVEDSKIKSDVITCGIYLFEPEVFKYLTSGKKISLERETFLELAKNGLLYGYKYDEGYFIDIGLPETYHKFKNDIISSLFLKKNNTIRQALQAIDRSGIEAVLIIDELNNLLGILTANEIKKQILGGANLDSDIEKIMNQKIVTAKINTSQENLLGLFELGLEHIPIVDESGTVKDIAFRPSVISMKRFPTVRGRTPLRISFSGGGTDLPYFFEKHGGVVLSAAIDKYCYATITKRADRKVVIDSDLTPETDVSVNSLENLKYDGKFDLIKAVIKLMSPDFGFELYLHNDVPPGRGLGSSASAAVLVISLLNHLQETNYDSYKIAEIAFKAEREELKIKGGWQDQYAAVTGGFNFMEFNGDKTIIYPLRLKEDIINELNHHLLLCYVGRGHESGEIHRVQEDSFNKKQEDSVLLLNSMKKIAIEMKDSLLTNKLDIFGKLLHDSWENKKILSPVATNNFIDNLYEIGLNNGADGGKLLGAGNGGYLLFFFNPKKRNNLTRALEKSGGDIMNFGFDLKGAQVWTVKNRI